MITYRRIRQLSPTEKEYMNFCLFEHTQSRALDNFSYEDELRSLRLNIDDPELRHLLITTRFSDNESIDLDAVRRIPMNIKVGDFGSVSQTTIHDGCVRVLGERETKLVKAVPVLGAQSSDL